MLGPCHTSGLDDLISDKSGAAPLPGSSAVTNARYCRWTILPRWGIEICRRVAMGIQIITTDSGE
ncbi:hypothetical protein J8J40_25490, partial [Mycobacterium tuberculosis]|nr:hypothetical protein [Mycobacterium tuberculosis]